MKVLSFDIGVKNLAWCITGESESSPSPWCIMDWGVWDLRVDLSDEPMRPEFCYATTHSGRECNKEPVYVEISGETIIGGLCKCHAKHSNTPFTSEHLQNLRNMSVSALKHRAQEYGFDVRRKLKKEIMADISTYMSTWCLHKIPPLRKAKTVPLPLIHKRILERLTDIHIHVDKVIIENQPVRMNAMMKSVQMILWTTLRMKMLQAGIPEPDVIFVNASKKLSVIPNSDSEDGKCYDILSSREATRQARGRSYADRKRESITRVETLLELTSQNQHLEWFRTNSKKDDLADCLLMCLGGTSSV